MRGNRRWLLGMAAGLAVAFLVAGLALWLMAGREVARRLPALREEAAGLESAGLGWGALSRNRRDVLLAVEDPSFMSHGGVDIWTPGSGLTTITQALVKGRFFEEFRPGPWNKLWQTVLALRLDDVLDKEAQLTLFLNAAGLGRGASGWVEGFDNAAWEYYGQPLSGITDQQFLELVAMLVAPGRLHPGGRSEALQERVRRIRRLLAGECAPRGVRDVFYEDCA